MPLRNPPPWWDWELELTVHAEHRMLERGITEVELREMLESAQALAPSHVEGRFIAEMLRKARSGRSSSSPTSSSGAWPW